LTFLDESSLDLLYFIAVLLDTDIVKNAIGQISFVYKKGEWDGDLYSVTDTTTTVSSITRDFTIPPMLSKPPAREGATAKSIPKKVPQPPVVRENMSADGSFVISKNVESNEPYPLLTSESWKLSGAIVIGIKKSTASQDPGIRIGVKETSNGRALFVSDISLSSPFVATPLRTGDIILSINSVSFRGNADVVGAYSALDKSKTEVTMVARKAENSLKEFLASRIGGTSVRSDVGAATPNSKISRSIKIPGSEFSGISHSQFSASNDKGCEEEERSSANGMEFDEESYDSALFGYNSSKSIMITKSDPLENIGMEFICLNTQWGKLLTVSKIMPDSKIATTTDIGVGDAILAVNGVNFREHPNVERALSLINRSPQNVYIEYQNLASFAPVVPVSKTKASHHQHDITEDSQPDYENEKLTIISLSDDGENQFDNRSKSESTNASSSKSARMKEPMRAEKMSRDGSVADKSTSEKVKQRPKRIWVTVKKENKKQQVGISLATMNGFLVVTKVSPTGILRGAPILPGGK
jgi:PDZ domain